VNERGLVEVPENAIRDEPIAFGLSGVQLAICGVAILVGAIVNLLPIAELLRLGLMVLLTTPIALAAALPVRGEPAYRWLVRAVGHRRGRRVWAAVLERPDKREISATEETGAAPAADAGGPTWQAVDNGEAAAIAEASSDNLPRGAGDGQTADRDGSPMTDGPLLRPHVLRPDDGDSQPEPPAAPRRGPAERPSVVPHLLPTLRVATFTSFAGGVGKTTLAVEVATYVAAHARYRTLDGEERPIRVVLLDASRLTIGAAGLRLGLDAARLSKASESEAWRQPSAIERLVAGQGSGVDLISAPPHPVTTGTELRLAAERELFRADTAAELVAALPRAGYHLLVVDLGSHLELAHTELIDRSDLVCGVVRPTLESLPDVHRLATFLRSIGAGRKVSLVANQASDVDAVRRHARPNGLEVIAAIEPHPAFVAAAERAEPAWRLAPALEPAIRTLATAVWPLLDAREHPARPTGLLGAVRRLALPAGRQAR
jgi:cellulose biosynthesis protein BcsQ